MINKEEVIDALKYGDGFKRYYSQNLTLLSKSNGQASARCPFHDDQNPSLSINLNDGQYNCFGCGQSGDIFSFRMKQEKITFDECLKMFAGELNLTPDKKEDSIRISIDDVKKWNANLLSGKAKAAKEFLNIKRGITDSSISKYYIGYDNIKDAITIPVINNGKLSSVKFFSYDYITGKKKITTSGKADLFGTGYLSILKAVDADIYITEGELDAIVLSQFGLFSVSGSAGALTWKEEWSKYFKGANVILCYDSDSAGREGAEKSAAELMEAANSIKIIDLFGSEASPDKKDITDYFVKQGRTFDSFKELVNNSPEMKKDEIKKANTYKSSRETIKKSKDGTEINKIDFLSLLQNEKCSLIINPAQDYAFGRMFYAVNVDKCKYLISSDENIVKFANAAEKNIHLTTFELDTFRFSPQGITKFLNNEDYATPYDIFTVIRRYIERFIFLKKEESYSLLALWVMGTYLYRLFRYFPYIHLNAEKGSGKTMLMEILAPVCFNGQISVNSTEAVIFRDIQNNSPTLFLDELEKMSKEEREKFAGIMAVLKTGFSKNGLVKRCDGKNKDKIRAFSTYAPKMFAGIKELDDVLSDRTIKIKMYRKLNNELFERYTECTEILDTQKTIRDMLYSFGLKYSAKIEEIYNEPCIPDEFCSILNNREQDIWLPIISIAQLIDSEQKSDIVKEILDYSASYISEKKTTDLLENDTVKLLSVLNQFLPFHEPENIKGNLYYYKTDTLYDYFKQQEEYSWMDNKTWLSKQLRKLEIKTEVFRGKASTMRVYLIDKAIISDYSERYC
jgi:hypothetical protein